MTTEGKDPAAGYVAAWRPSLVPPPAAGFARQVVTAAAPAGRDRAKCLLWAAGKLAAWAIPLGLDPVPGVLLHPSVIERFAMLVDAAYGVLWYRAPISHGTLDPWATKSLAACVLAAGAS